MKLNATTHSLEETQAFGAALAALLNPGVTVLLFGGLGMGKTALTQGIAKGLGITKRVTSPTFTMVAIYSVDGRRGITSLLHADLYRVGSGIEADDLALGELVEEQAIAVVEWGDVAPDVLGRHRVIITLALGTTETDRTFTIVDDSEVLNEQATRVALESWMTS